MMSTLPMNDCSTLWKSYNDENSWLPFICPFVIWMSSYLYCCCRIVVHLPNKSIGKPYPPTSESFRWCDWHLLHNVHNVGAVLLGMISLYFDDDQILNERVVILWNFSYFCVDLVDTTTRWDLPYTMHAICCLGLGAFNYTTPLSRHLRMNSQGAQLELSTPFLHIAKRTRNPFHFLLFAVMFTLCRIIWIPIMMMQLRDHGMEWTDVRLIVVMAFYGLNWFWYTKILKILIDGLLSKTMVPDTAKTGKIDKEA